MGHAGLARFAARVTNVVQVRPPQDEWERHDPADVVAGTLALSGLLAQEKPKLILALGEQALHACLGLGPDAKQYSILEARGYTFPGPFGPVLASVHPAYVLRNWMPGWALLQKDCEKAARLLHNYGAPQPVRTERVVGLGGVLFPSVASLWAEAQLCGGVMAVDIETGPTVDVKCVGFAVTPEVGWCVPLASWSEHFVRNLLASAIPKVFHNGQFDVTVLEREGFQVKNWVGDTMLEWHAREPLLAGQRSGGEKAKRGNAKRRTEKSLRFLASILTDEPFWKNYDFATEAERWTLCAKDARVTLEVYQALRRMV